MMRSTLEAKLTEVRPTLPASRVSLIGAVTMLLAWALAMSSLKPEQAFVSPGKFVSGAGSNEQSSVICEVNLIYNLSMYVLCKKEVKWWRRPIKTHRKNHGGAGSFLVACCLLKSTSSGCFCILPSSLVPQTFCSSGSSALSLQTLFVDS
mgnify:CR=1 FL=1